MARREVFEITCDRCKRTETQPLETKPQNSPEFKMIYGGTETVFNDLCRRCRATLSNQISLLLMKNEEKEEPKKPVEEPKKSLFAR